MTLGPSSSGHTGRKSLFGQSHRPWGDRTFPATLEEGGPVPRRTAHHVRRAAMRWHNGGMGAGGWIVMTVSMVLFWTVVVVLVLALIRYLDRAPHRHPDAPSNARADVPS